MSTLEVQHRINGSSLAITESGITLNDPFVVSGIVADEGSRLYVATQCPGIPRYGDPHPNIPGIFVTNVDASAIEGDPTKAQLVITYSVPRAEEALPSQTSKPLKSMSAGTVSQQTSTDVDGNIMVVGYSGQVTRTESGGTSVEGELSVAKVSVQRPQLTVSVRRREDLFPIRKGTDFVGKINSIPWSGYPKKTWLIASISADETGENFNNVTYNFAYNEDTWDIDATHSSGGVTPIGITDGNGLVKFQVYKSIDFNQLGIHIN